MKLWAVAVILGGIAFVTSQVAMYRADSGGYDHAAGWWRVTGALSVASIITWELGEGGA